MFGKGPQRLAHGGRRGHVRVAEAEIADGVVAVLLLELDARLEHAAYPRAVFNGGTHLSADDVHWLLPVSEPEGMVLESAAGLRGAASGQGREVPRTSVHNAWEGAMPRGGLRVFHASSEGKGAFFPPFWTRRAKKAAFFFFGTGIFFAILLGTMPCRIDQRTRAEESPS